MISISVTSVLHCSSLVAKFSHILGSMLCIFEGKSKPGILGSGSTAIAPLNAFEDSTNDTNDEIVLLRDSSVGGTEALPKWILVQTTSDGLVGPGGCAIVVPRKNE